MSTKSHVRKVHPRFAAQQKCCICGNDFKGWGNNPRPVKRCGVCCDGCNWEVVLPARFKQIQGYD